MHCDAPPAEAALCVLRVPQALRTPAPHAPRARLVPPRRLRVAAGAAHTGQHPSYAPRPPAGAALCVPRVPRALPARRAVRAPRPTCAPAPPACRRWRGAHRAAFRLSRSAASLGGALRFARRATTPRARAARGFGATYRAEPPKRRKKGAAASALPLWLHLRAPALPRGGGLVPAGATAPRRAAATDPPPRRFSALHCNAPPAVAALCAPRPAGACPPARRKQPRPPAPPRRGGVFL